MRHTVHRFLQYYRSLHISLYAAGTAFFLLLSVLPLMILALRLVEMLPFTQDEFLTFAGKLLPDAFHPMFQYLINTLSRAQLSTLFPVTAVTLLWSSSRGTLGLMQGLNAIYQISEHRNYLTRRFISIGHTLLLLASIFLMLILYLFSGVLFSLLTKVRFGIPLVSLLETLRHILSPALLTLFFTIFYKILPNETVPLRQALPGAVICAAGWLALSAGFSYYVSYISNHTALYGSLGSLMLAIVWLYLCVNLVFYGGMLNAFLKKRMAQSESAAE